MTQKLNFKVGMPNEGNGGPNVKNPPKKRDMNHEILVKMTGFLYMAYYVLSESHIIPL